MKNKRKISCDAGHRMSLPALTRCRRSWLPPTFIQRWMCHFQSLTVIQTIPRRHRTVCFSSTLPGSASDQNMNFSAALCLAEYHNRKMATDLAMACVGVAIFFFNSIMALGWSNYGWEHKQEVARLCCSHECVEFHSRQCAYLCIHKCLQSRCLLLFRCHFFYMKF